MTPQEAIKNIDDILDSPYLYDKSIDYQLTTDDIECLEMAKEALEKQIPKKPLWGGTNNASWRSCLNVIQGKTKRINIVHNAVKNFRGRVIQNENHSDMLHCLFNL